MYLKAKVDVQVPIDLLLYNSSFSAESPLSIPSFNKMRHEFKENFTELKAAFEGKEYTTSDS